MPTRRMRCGFLPTATSTRRLASAWTPCARGWRSRSTTCPQRWRRRLARCSARRRLARRDLIAEARTRRPSRISPQATLPRCAAMSAACAAAPRALRGIRCVTSARSCCCASSCAAQARATRPSRYSRPLKRMPASALPRVLRSRRDLVGELLAGDVRCAEVAVAAHLGDRAARARAVRAERRRGPSGCMASPSTPVDDAIEVLRVCQNAVGRSDDADAGVRAGAAAGPCGGSRVLRRRARRPRAARLARAAA